MSSPSLLITCVSWEERYVLGTRRLIESHDIGLCLSFAHTEKSVWSDANRKAVNELAKDKGIDVKHEKLVFADPVQSWRAITREIPRAAGDFDHVIVDLSTMPRAMIFTVLWALNRLPCAVDCVYHAPEKYSDSWLSRDPDRPRILFKLGGEMRLGLDTVIVIQTGFDVERVNNMLVHFEPQKIALGIQHGSQFDNDELNLNRFKKEFDNDSRVEMFKINSYGDDGGESQIAKVVSKYAQTNNVIMSSLGPKVTTVPMFKVHLQFPKTALAYSPPREINEDYSKGIGDAIWHHL